MTTTTFIDVPEVRPYNSTGRTPSEFQQLIKDLRERPGEWAIYSTHNKPRTAGPRARVLKDKRMPRALQPYRDNIQFRSHDCHVLIRWVNDAAE